MPCAICTIGNGEWCAVYIQVRNLKVWLCNSRGQVKICVGQTEVRYNILLYCLSAIPWRASPVAESVRCLCGVETRALLCVTEMSVECVSYTDYNECV